MIREAVRGLVSKTSMKPWSWMEDDVIEALKADEAMKDELAGVVADEARTLNDEASAIAERRVPTEVIQRQPTHALQRGARTTYKLAVLHVAIGVAEQQYGSAVPSEHPAGSPLKREERDALVSDVLDRAEEN